MAIDSSQYNFMLSAADTMADNYRMQEEAERQERERVYKRKMLEEAMAQKEKEAQLQYKRQQQAAKDNAFMNYALGVDGNNAYPVVDQQPKKRVAATSGVPNSTTGNPYASTAYIPTKGDDASAALYRFNASAATDEDKNLLNVSGRLPRSHYEKQVFNTDISYEGVQQLLDSGYTEDQIGDMTTEEKIKKLIDIDRKQAEDNVLSRKQPAYNLSRRLADGVNAAQEKGYEENKAKSADDMFKKLDAQIAEAQANVDVELEALAPELNRLTNMGLLELRDEKIKAVRDKYGLDNLLKQRKEISTELKMFNEMYGDEYRKAFFEDNLEGDAKFRKEKKEAWAKRIKPLIDDYNRKLFEEKYPGVQIKEPTITEEEAREEYKKLPNGDYFTTTKETVPLKADDARYERYKKIKEAEEKGEFNTVYNLLTEEERKRFFPNYDPKKQREFNYRYELKQKAQAEKDAQANTENYLKLTDVQIAIIKAKQGIPLTTDESNALQNALGHDDATVAYDEAKAYDDATLQKFGISPAQARNYGNRLTEEYGTRVKAENEAAKKAKREKYENAMRISYSTLMKYSRDKNYEPTEADQKHFANLVADGMSPEAAANTIFTQKIKDEKIEINKVSEANATGLRKIYGKRWGDLDHADQESIAAKVNGVLGKLSPEQKALLGKKPKDLSDKELEEQWKILERINDKDWTFGTNANAKVVSFPSPVAQLYRANGIEGFRRQIIRGGDPKLKDVKDFTTLFAARYPTWKSTSADTQRSINSALKGTKPDKNAPQIVQAAYYQYLLNKWLEKANEYELNK